MNLEGGICFEVTPPTPPRKLSVGARFNVFITYSENIYINSREIIKNCIFKSLFKININVKKDTVAFNSNFYINGGGVRQWQKKYAVDRWEPIISILLSFVSSKPFSNWKSTENSQKAKGFSKIPSHWNFIFRKFSKLS